MLQFSFPGPNGPVSYHNHSNWSDGLAPLEEVCRAGKVMGLRELGMSDHWVLAPHAGMGEEEWSMPLDKLGAYVETLQRLKRDLEDDSFTLRIGLEVDFFFENIDQVLARLAQFPLDYLIGSVHYSGDFPIDHAPGDWAPLSQAQINKIWDIYWDKLEAAAACGAFSFLGHLDLPKKFAFYPTEDILPRAIRVLEAASKSGTPIELNTAGWEKTCKEQYPALPILKEARARSIPVIVNADAHAPAHLMRHFDRADELLRKAGYR